jgi:hypothetical protein
MSLWHCPPSSSGLQQVTTPCAKSPRTTSALRQPQPELPHSATTSSPPCGRSSDYSRPAGSSSLTPPSDFALRACKAGHRCR